MRKGELENLRQMIDSLTHRIWRVECLGHLLENTLAGGETIHKIDCGMLTLILNDNIRKTLRKLDKLDKYCLNLD